MSDSGDDARLQKWIDADRAAKAAGMRLAPVLSEGEVTVKLTSEELDWLAAASANRWALEAKLRSALGSSKGEA